jgi:hypothetical protein
MFASAFTICALESGEASLRAELGDVDLTKTLSPETREWFGDTVHRFLIECGDVASRWLAPSAAGRLLWFTAARHRDGFGELSLATTSHDHFSGYAQTVGGRETGNPAWQEFAEDMRTLTEWAYGVGEPTFYVAADGLIHRA